MMDFRLTIYQCLKCNSHNKTDKEPCADCGNNTFNRVRIFYKLPDLETKGLTELQKEYIMLTNTINTSIYKRLLEKHDKHKDSWKTSELNDMREHIVSLYKLLLVCWMNKVPGESKRLLDVAIQSLLLYLRLEESK